ncbi:MAG: HAD family hydrolase [Armatimonadetes bacterium]|nr:HAD family hydrolase [Armatimonadota bacterium]
MDIPLTCILFDMDGTLVDTTDLIAEGLGSTIEIGLGRRPPREELVALIGRPLREQLREYIEEEQVAALSDRFMTFYEDRRGEMEVPFPGAFNMLHEARRLGLKVGIVTSKNRREIEGTLDLLRIRDLLDFVVSSEDAPLPKPAPDPVWEALRRAEAQPDAALFIGDSVYDMQSGNTAGVRTGGALWGPFGRAILEPERPTYLFETPDDVTARLPQLAGRDPESTLA